MNCGGVGGWTGCAGQNGRYFVNGSECSPMVLNLTFSHKVGGSTPSLALSLLSLTLWRPKMCSLDGWPQVILDMSMTFVYQSGPDCLCNIGHVMAVGISRFKNILCECVVLYVIKTCPSDVMN